jgi:hypothetical protein
MVGWAPWAERRTPRSQPHTAASQVLTAVADQCQDDGCQIDLTIMYPFGNVYDGDAWSDAVKSI